MTTKTYNVDILENLNDEIIISKGVKTLTTTNDRACEWVKTKEKNTVIVPNLSSTLKVKETEKKGIPNMICVLNNGTNRVEKNEKECSFLSSQYSGNIGVPVNENNFYKATTLFSARKSVKPTWLNMKDEYTSPNTEHPEWKEFELNSVVYSIFNNRSYQSSLRQVEYKNETWDVKNEFFWLSKDFMVEIAEEIGYTQLVNDARFSENRYVHNLLYGNEPIVSKLFPESILVLNKATELVKKSILERYRIADAENHLDSWDAGYAQLKLVWKEYFQEDFKEFRQLYKNLEDRMRPLVYELGFLMK
jgi:hypothetical protein